MNYLITDKTSLDDVRDEILDLPDSSKYDLQYILDIDFNHTDIDNYLLVVEDDSHYLMNIIRFLSKATVVSNVILVNNSESFFNILPKLKTPPLAVSLDFVIGSSNKVFEETSEIYNSLKKTFRQTPILGYTNFEESGHPEFSEDTKKLVDLFTSNFDSVFDKRNINAASVYNNIIRDVVRISQYKIENEKLIKENKKLSNEVHALKQHKNKIELMEEAYENGDTPENPAFRVLERKLIGNSKALKKVKFYIEKAAENDAPVFIGGESGTGKENVARAIHRLDKKRCSFKFETIDCTTIPENLFESELFGYEPGAFTDARSKGKKGIIELAHKGTLFLDEIGDLSVINQARLLKVIQEKKFRRVGGTKDIKVNFRVISATNKNLSELVEKDEFRMDLYYRITTFQFPEVPALSQRVEDIPLLIDHFTKVNKSTIQFSDECISFIKKLSFKGNIRELEGLITKLCSLFSDGETITSDEIKHLLPSDQKQAIDQRAYYFLSEMMRIANKYRNKTTLSQEFISNHFKTKDGQIGINPTTLKQGHWLKYKSDILKLIEAEWPKYETLIEKCQFIRSEFEKR